MVFSYTNTERLALPCHLSLPLPLCCLSAAADEVESVQSEQAADNRIWQSGGPSWTTGNGGSWRYGRKLAGTEDVKSVQSKQAVDNRIWQSGGPSWTGGGPSWGRKLAGTDGA